MTVCIAHNQVQPEESILKDEYNSINQKIRYLQEANLLALQLIYPSPEFDKIVDEYTPAPVLKPGQWNSYEVTSIWLCNQHSARSYSRNLEDAIRTLKAERTEIVRGLLGVTPQ